MVTLSVLFFTAANVQRGTEILYIATKMEYKENITFTRQTMTILSNLLFTYFLAQQPNGGQSRLIR
jgi:hypothetical protein